MRVHGGCELYGREHELGVIGQLAASLAGHAGGALVIRGEPGIGKSALLAEAMAAATSRRLRVLPARCARPEAGISFAGLHRLLHPLLPRADRLPPRQRRALLAACGLSDDGLDPLAAGLAALELIAGDQARPTLGIIDDAQWLDDASGTVLGLVARRLGGRAGALVIAVSDGHRSRFDAAGLAELRLGRLADAQARALLGSRAPSLDPGERLLAAAAGNPLALTELPVTWPAAGTGATALPLTDRLRNALSAPVAELPPATRSLLIIAAADSGVAGAGPGPPPADDGVTLAELLAAASIGQGRDLSLDDISPASCAGLVDIRQHVLAFTHPLLPAAIYQTATVARRHAAHAALAQVLARRPAGPPDRWVRHQAAAALERPDQPTRTAISAAAERIPLPADEPVKLALLACADPARHGALACDVIARKAIDPADPAGMYLIGLAAMACGDCHSSLGFLDAAVAGFRSQARHGVLARALACQAWAAVQLARGHLAAAAGQEAAHLALRTGQPRLVAAARLAKAAIVAQRGDSAEADLLISGAEPGLADEGTSTTLALAQFVRGHGAVTRQCYEQGAVHLRRALDPADPACHQVIGAWGLADLIEATTRTGERDAAAAYLRQLESLARLTRAPLYRAQAAYARPMLAAADEQAEVLCRAALGRDLAGWPCLRGRMLLWYGRWLRRSRRIAESRGPLRTARDSFEALGFRPLAECARRELRASGERGQRSGSADQLTAQELQIARLAADGLSNREIGQQLCISHRTVGYHLHRVFPKLGITSRSQLHAAVIAS